MQKSKIAQYSMAQNRTEYSPVEDQPHCQTDFILTLLQRLNPLSLSIHSASQWACWLFAAESPCLPITSTFGPRCVKVVSIPCQIHLLAACWQIGFYWAWNSLTRQRIWRGGKDELRSKKKMNMKSIRKVPGGGRKEKMERGGEREHYLAPCRLSASLALGKRLNSDFCFALGWVYCHV